MLRDIRKQQGMTGIDLGRATGISQSKISKIEGGRYPRLQLSEINKILNILKVSETIRQQIYELVGREQPAGLLHRPYTLRNWFADQYKREQQATNIRMYALHVIPAPLQTAVYRLAALRQFGIPEDAIPHGMRDAEKRQDLLWDTTRHFTFILHQAALYTMPPGAQAGALLQLDRIERFIDVPHIKIGIIPLEAGLPIAELGPFVLHDQTTLFIASALGDTSSVNAQDIATHERIFAELEQLAMYSGNARELIRIAQKHWES